MIRFLDTDVLVDCLRGTPSAAAWLAESSSDAFQVPGIAAMELVVGCRTRADLRMVERFLARFDIIWLEAAEFAQAHKILAQTRFTPASAYRTA